VDLSGRRCGSGFWGGQRPSLAPYVTGMGPKDGEAIASGGHGSRETRSNSQIPTLFPHRFPVNSHALTSVEGLWDKMRWGVRGDERPALARRELSDLVKLDLEILLARAHSRVGGGFHGETRFSKPSLRLPNRLWPLSTGVVPTWSPERSQAGWFSRLPGDWRRVQAESRARCIEDL
jgi:hypothetical protein